MKSKVGTVLCSKVASEVIPNSSFATIQGTHHSNSVDLLVELLD